MVKRAAPTSFAQFLSRYMEVNRFTHTDIAFFLRVTPKSVRDWLAGSGPGHVAGGTWRRRLESHERFFRSLKAQVDELNA